MPDVGLGRVLGIAAFAMVCVRMWQGWKARRAMQLRDKARQAKQAGHSPKP